jgi:RHS repeat-associated protein
MAGVAETTIYIGGLLEKVTTSNGTVFRHYVPAGHNTVLHTRLSAAQGSYCYMTQDHLGSTAVITDSSAVRLVTEKFTALGWSDNTAAEQTTIDTITRHGFTGHENMDNLSFVNMNGRVYNYSGSRFLSPDPTIPDPTNTSSYNRYAYVNYNPLTYTDPSGYVACVGGVRLFLRRHDHFR